MGNCGLSFSARAVDISPMINPKHGDFALFVINLVDDAIRTTPRQPQAGELAHQRVAQTTRRLDKRSNHELDDGRSDRFWQAGE